MLLDLHIEGLGQETLLDTHKDNFDQVMNQSESNFKKVKLGTDVHINVLKQRYSIESMARGDKFLSTSVLFKKLANKMEEHDHVMEKYKLYVK